MEQIAIFANPIAGKGKGRALCDKLLARFAVEGWRGLAVYEKPADVADEVLAGVTVAISIGGDGTLRAVVERLSRRGLPARPDVLVVPMGTANLMARHLNLPLSSRGLDDRAVSLIRNRTTRSIDAARLQTADQTAASTFLLMVGVGLDGEIVHALERVRRGPIGYLSYLRPALGVLAGYSFPEIEVSLDGGVVWPMGPAVAFVGNAREYGTGFAILPDARTDDGMLDLCVLPAKTPFDLMNHAFATLTGDHVRGDSVVHMKGKHIRVTSSTRVAVQADGDAAGFTPLEIELLPEPVRFIVAENE